MPAIYTHYVFANYLVKNIQDEKYFSLFILGNQGPDVFFHSDKKDQNKNYAYATLLHKINCSSSFMYLYHYVLAIEDLEKRQRLMTFINGLLAHYCLDRNLHPYIYYRTLFNSEEYPDKSYFYYHALFESRLDAAILHQFVKKNISPAICLKCDDAYVKEVSEMMASLAKNELHLDYIDDESYYRSLKAFRRDERLLYSKYGFKRELFKIFHLKKDIAYAFSTPTYNIHVVSGDYLNLKHNLWKHPVTGASNNTDVLTMMDKALNEYKELLQNLKDNYLDPLRVDTCLRMYVDGIDHDGCSINSQKIFFDSMFLKPSKNKKKSSKKYRKYTTH